VLKKDGRIGISVASQERPHDVQVILREILHQHGVTREPGGSTPHRVSAAQLACQLEDGGFLVDEIRLRTFTDVFADPAAVIAFSLSSSFGNFLADLPEPLRRTVQDRFTDALERRRGSDGIVLKRRLLFVVATGA